MSSQLDMLVSDASDVEEHTTEAEWLSVRRSSLGASEAPVVLGLSPYKTALQLFGEKLGVIQPEPQTEAQAWGLLLEEPMALRYASDTGHTLRNPGRYTLRRSRTLPWLVATLDREIVKADDRPVPAPLELKLRSFAKPGTWEDEPPVDVLVQVQHQLAVTGWQWAAVAVLLSGREFRRFVVPRHDAFIVKLLDAEAQFMARLKMKEPPPVDGSARTREVLRALYPTHEPGLVVNLPGEAVDWDTERSQAIADGKDADGRKTAAENNLLAALGEAETGVLPNGVTYTYKASERKGYTVAASVVRTLRRQQP